ncbi:unnamed protein product [Cuscuta campestris]|uniref:Peroxidase n=1 Tax=Cuscuta campestris TaxID=132261 RepID=A0A484NN25_9ASTE|nr:unnamed protein product [Cuscuta campestris]
MAAQLRRICPPGGNSKNAGTGMDPSSTTFDNNYYKLVLQGKGLFSSDQALLANPKTRALVLQYASSQEAFFKAFANSMIKMSSITGGEGPTCNSYTYKLGTAPNLQETFPWFAHLRKLLRQIPRAIPTRTNWELLQTCKKRFLSLRICASFSGRSHVQFLHVQIGNCSKPQKLSNDRWTRCRAIVNSNRDQEKLLSGRSTHSTGLQQRSTVPALQQQQATIDGRDAGRWRGPRIPVAFQDFLARPFAAGAARDTPPPPPVAGKPTSPEFHFFGGAHHHNSAAANNPLLQPPYSASSDGSFDGLPPPPPAGADRRRRKRVHDSVDKRHVRMMKNREAAARSRARKEESHSL